MRQAQWEHEGRGVFVLRNGAQVGVTCSRAQWRAYLDAATVDLPLLIEMLKECRTETHCESVVRIATRHAS